MAREKQRRQTVNRNGIDRLKNVDSNVVWVLYTCVNCRRTNFVNIGKELIKPQDALENCRWNCQYCGFTHAQNAELPDNWDNWRSELLNSDSPSCEGFWKGFFTIATENPSAYWKQCKTCGRILPYSAFSKHVKWGALEKQLECRSCKGAINAIGNGVRTTEQLREGSARRRLGDLLSKIDSDTRLDIEEIFRRFDGKCFKTKIKLNIKDTQSYHIDHILPAKYFYPLTMENAALLSASANENKKALWPSQFYTPQELVELSKITGANLELLSSKEPVYNPNIDVNAAIDKYLNVRNNTDLQKRINKLKDLLTANKLLDNISEDNKKRLGFDDKS